MTSNVNKWIIGIGAATVIWLVMGAFKRKLVNTIEFWEPGVFDKENDYRRNLASLIRSRMPKAHVQEEYAIERSKVDILVSEEIPSEIDGGECIAVELKLNLSRNPDLDRLIGQLVSYQQNNYTSAIVVSINPEPNFSRILDERARSDGLDGFVTVIEHTVTC